MRHRINGSHEYMYSVIILIKSFIVFSALSSFLATYKKVLIEILKTNMVIIIHLNFNDLFDVFQFMKIQIKGAAFHILLSVN